MVEHQLSKQKVASSNPGSAWSWGERCRRSAKGPDRGFKLLDQKVCAVECTRRNLGTISYFQTTLLIANLYNVFLGLRCIKAWDREKLHVRKNKELLELHITH